jgi:flagellar basal-body rod protein FlgB
MMMLDTPMLRRLDAYLDLTAFRQAVIAGNIANVDTPGYHTRDIAFQAEFLRAQSRLRLVEPQVREVPGLVHRPDGNNVNLERESLLLAQTQLQFRTGVQLMKAEFRRLLTAINEGK